MKYTIRPLALLVASALVVTLAGCSGNAVSTTTAFSAAETILSATETEFSLEGATAFTFTDGGISAAEGDYSGYTIKGTALTISAAGTYVVSGNCVDGSITIKGDTENVMLILNGLELTSTTTAPVVCGKSTEVTIAVQNGMTPPNGTNRQTPPARGGNAPGGQAPEGQGGTPPEKPTGTPSGNPPQMPTSNNAISQTETAAG